MIHISQLLLSLSLSLLAAPPAQQGSPEDEKAIREAAAKYVEAYNRGDVDALAAAYAPDASYDEGEGPVVKGRAEIRKALAANLAASPGTKMAIDIKSIRFIRGRAIEIGVATLTPSKGEPIKVPYRVIHSKQPDGKWL